MNKTIVLFLLLVWLVGCSPTEATKSSPTITPEPTSKPTIEPTTEPIDQPVTIDFGGGSQYTQLLFDDVETGDLLPGFDFGEYGDAVVTTEPGQVVDGEYSIRLSQYGHIKSNPDVLPLEGDSTYLIEFDYKILDRGNESENIMYFGFQPVGENIGSQDSLISTFDMLQNADEQGTFTTGARTGNEPGYQFSINTTEKASVVIDNIRVLQQGKQKLDQPPKYWENISTLPFPRLGNYMQGSMQGISWGIGGEPPGTYSVNQLIDKFSMYNLIFGVDIRNQTFDPGFAYQLRRKNPNIILLPYLSLDGQNLGPDSEHIYGDGSVDIYHNFASGISDQWIMIDTEENPVEIKDWGGCCLMNISEYSPTVNGKTYNGYITEWITDTILPFGEWDGVFFDNLFGRVSFYIPNNTDPAAFDFDHNLNGLRDETPALVSEMYRNSSIRFLENLRTEIGEPGIIMGNTGATPEIFLAPYVNGYSFECVDEAWNAEWLPAPSESGWRKVLDSYFIMEKESISPAINVFEGCGRTGDFIEPDHIYLTPTEKDIRSHRFTLGTTLLGNGFYEYDLFDARSAPYWFDEFTVDSNGVAVEDPKYKGYLGLALGDAVELRSAASVFWEEDFESCSMSLEAGDPKIYISQAIDDLISGTCSLVIDNPDHTRQAEIVAQLSQRQVNFNSGKTYLVEFDWLILETIDGAVESTLWIGDDEFTVYGIPGNVKGDGGTAYFPFTLPEGDRFSLRFLLGSGGGKVAFDNIRITEGGAGPWRRDFENGFVLVNPINRTYTFSPEELAGTLNRTGIRRILGTQAPNINNGKFVTGDLTLEPFDAIILLADPIPAE